MFSCFQIFPSPLAPSAHLIACTSRGPWIVRTWATDLGAAGDAWASKLATSSSHIQSHSSQFQSLAFLCNNIIPEYPFVLRVRICIILCLFHGGICWVKWQSEEARSVFWYRNLLAWEPECWVMLGATHLCLQSNGHWSEFIHLMNWTRSLFLIQI